MIPGVSHLSPKLRWWEKRFKSDLQAPPQRAHFVFWAAWTEVTLRWPHGWAQPENCPATKLYYNVNHNLQQHCSLKLRHCRCKSSRITLYNCNWPQASARRVTFIICLFYSPLLYVITRHSWACDVTIHLPSCTRSDFLLWTFLETRRDVPNKYKTRHVNWKQAGNIWGTLGNTLVKVTILLHRWCA